MHAFLNQSKWRIDHLPNFLYRTISQLKKVSATIARRRYHNLHPAALLYAIPSTVKSQRWKSAATVTRFTPVKHGIMASTRVDRFHKVQALEKQEKGGS